MADRLARVLITGTDTGVGKTFVGAALGRALAARGRQVVAVKPVETGCGPEPTAEEDGVRLALATGQRAPRAALLRLRTPVAAAVAGDLEGVAIDFEWLVERVAACVEGAELALIEGAGGLLAPITWHASAADLARRLGARVLLVGGDRLGTIHHTLATVQAIERAGLRLAGVVLSAPPEPDPSTGLNRGAIERLSGIRRILALPRCDMRQAARLLDEVTGWLES